jgi:CHAT domain-containing protein
MPFEILLTRNVDEKTAWNEMPYLARSFSPVYAPSAAVYLKLRNSKERRAHDLDLFALGDPDFSSLGASPPLEPLPSTRTEVMGISRPLKKDKRIVLLGPDANEHLFKRELRRSSPRLLHLATHGLVDPLDPAASSVVLGADGPSGEDGYLHTLEILSLPISAGLVVLSACESAKGRVSRGEGVVGLSRAFIASGAGGTVASLWSVSDESTAVLMKDFYSRMLGKKETAGNALNGARFALMKTPEYAHPFYWSPFVVIGSDRSPW